MYFYLILNTQFACNEPKTSGAENPMAFGITPLLTIDVWEHGEMFCSYSYYQYCALKLILYFWCIKHTILTSKRGEASTSLPSSTNLQIGPLQRKISKVLWVGMSCKDQY